MKWRDNGQLFDVMMGHFIDPNFWKHIELGDIVGVELSAKILEKCTLLTDGVFPDIEYFSLKNDSLYFDGKYTATDIKYLHQFQNLYSALAGTELEVNL